MLYWVWWNPFKRLVQFPTTYNMIAIFHAYPADGEVAGGNTGAVVLRKPGGVIGTNLNADIATCRARGQKILVSVGGAGGQVYITSQARADAFIASIKSMNVGLGGSGTTLAFDGIDWNNFEGVQQGSQGAWMSYVGQQLRAFYGDDFIFCAPPAAFGPTQHISDRALLAELYQNGVLDWMCPQYYDPSGLNTLANARFFSDFYNGAVTINGQSVQIPRDHIGVGFSIKPTGASTGSRWGVAEAISAYTTLVSDGRTPKGAFNWSNEEDTGDVFASQVAPNINNNADPVIDNPAFTLATSSNFADSAATTAQLTAPSGKTSGADFQAGEMCETSNPAPALNLGSGKYTEVEWCITATTDAEDAAQYEFRVTRDGVSLATYSVTPKWTIGTPPQPPDTTAPSQPTNLNATAVSSTQITLTWTGSTDNIGVAGYKIYRDSVLIETLENTLATSYADTGLTPETLYSYTVSAYDAATNESTQSASDSATTNAAPGGGDATDPVITNMLPAFDPEGKSGTITLSADVTDNVAVDRVEFWIHSGTVLIGTDTVPVGNTYSVSFDTTILNNTTYLWQVIAYDTSENSKIGEAFIVIDNPTAPPIPADAPKVATAVGSITGLSTITL